MKKENKDSIKRFHANVFLRDELLLQGRSRAQKMNTFDDFVILPPEEEGQDGTARILVVGDMHFSERSLPLLEGLKSSILRAINEHTPDAVVFLGDTLDRFININSMRLTEATEFFYLCTTLTRIILLIGNHDVPLKSGFFSTYHGFNAMRHYWQNTIVVDREAVEFDVKDFRFRAVAYCPNGSLQKGLETLRRDKCGDDKRVAATFCHQEIKGHKLGYLTGDDGDPWPLGQGLLIAGHIHLHHHMPATKERDEILYTGSPYQDNHSESPDKSISLITFTPEGWREERIFLGLPRKEVKEMTAKEYTLWTPARNVIYTLEVIGTLSETSEHTYSEKTQTLRKEGSKVTFSCPKDRSEYFPDDTRVVMGASRPLRECIADSISDKPRLQRVFARVFL